MASEEGGTDDLGSSLFEGMVLFSPSDISSPDVTVVVVVQSPPPPPSPPPSPPPPPASPLPSQPLDEDLFSDLSLQTQPSDPPQSPTLESPPQTTRQISRKKKRAVRIGYARDSSVPEDPPPPTSSCLVEEEPPPRLDIDANQHHDHRPDPPPSSELRLSPTHRESPPGETAEEERDDLCSNRILEEDMDLAIEQAPTTPGAPEKEDAFVSIDEKLEFIRSQISEKLDRIREAATSVSAERKELGRRRRRAAENVNLASLRYNELEKELEEACESEDFERAERLSESLMTVEKEKDGFLNALRDAEVEYDYVDSKMHEVLELQIAAEEEGVSLLEQFAKDAADNADLILKNAREISSKEVEDWQSSMEGLEIKRLEMDIESHLISEARSGLETSIEHLVEDDRKEKEILSRKRDVLAKEMEELQKLVRLKEAEIAENDSQIQEVEKRISNMASKFHETQSSIDMKYADLQSALSRIESEGEALFMKKKEIDEFTLLAERKSLKLRELASVSVDEAKTCQDLVGLRKSLASSISKSGEDKVMLAKTEKRISEDIQILRQQVSAARTSLQELSSTRACIQQEIASFKQKISFIEKRGPELEAEKKIAAAARNFKEAGRIAAEAKALNVEKEILQNNREKAVLDLEKLEKEIKDTVDEIQENEGLILSKDKEAATAMYQRLRLVAAAARAERSAALQLGDSEEGDILLQEAEAAESKARELHEAYGLESEDLGKAVEHFVSIAFITNLAGQHLAEMASSFHLPAANGSQ